jgi:hypothetical protein
MEFEKKEKKELQEIGNRNRNLYDLRGRKK